VFYTVLYVGSNSSRVYTVLHVSFWGVKGAEAVYIQTSTHTHTTTTTTTHGVFQLLLQPATTPPYYDKQNYKSGCM
jgi:hypothetical protein